jgi:protein-S-isoprenylcysteine O-methyltransferase Ste14
MLAAAAIVILVGMVLARVLLLRRAGIEAMKFGGTHRTDFVIPPFALLYIYLVLAAAFGWPTLSLQQFFRSEIVSWLGVLSCVLGLLLFLWGMISFGSSFRVGIDTDRPDRLVTTGAFALSRNPLYAAFGLVLLGEFLVFPNWLFLLYMAAGAWLFHRQVLREERHLEQHYGRQYVEYRRRVRRYF